MVDNHDTILITQVNNVMMMSAVLANACAIIQMCILVYMHSLARVNPMCKSLT